MKMTQVQQERSYREMQTTLRRRRAHDVKRAVGELHSLLARGAMSARFAAVELDITVDDLNDLFKIFKLSETGL